MEKTMFCNKCNKQQSLENFHKSRVSRGGKHHTCIRCHAKDNREWYLKNREAILQRQREKRHSVNPDIKRDYRFRRIYKITLQNYYDMEMSQNGCCAICEEAPARDLLCVDHDHDTGKVRGLLCGRCNRVLGSMEDNPILLEKMIKYLAFQTVNNL